MDKRRAGRPSAEYPYVCGPYQHRAKWRIVIVRGRRADGQRDVYYQTAESRSKALEWIRKFREILRASGRSVEDAVKEYIAHQTRNGNKPGTIATNGYRLKAILDYSMPLIDLNQRRGQDLYDELVDEGGAVDTHQGCLVQARAFGKFCVSRPWLTINPFAKVESVGKKSRGKDQLRLDEARAYSTHCLKVWREDRDRTAIAALLPLLMNLRARGLAAYAS